MCLFALKDKLQVHNKNYLLTGALILDNIKYSYVFKTEK